MHKYSVLYRVTIFIIFIVFSEKAWYRYHLNRNIDFGHL